MNERAHIVDLPSSEEQEEPSTPPAGIATMARQQTDKTATMNMTIQHPKWGGTTRRCNLRRCCVRVVPPRRSAILAVNKPQPR